MIDRELITSLAERNEDALPRCPACGRTNDLETRICACGFWFEKKVMLQPASNDAPAKPVRSGTRARSVFSAAAVLIAAASIVVAWSGIVGRMWHENPESEFAVSPSGDAGLSDAAAAGSAPKNIIDGKVTAVLSGDLVTILDPSNNEHQVRLAGIDLAKLDGEGSKDMLSEILLGRPVHVVLQKMDGGDLAGKLFLDGVNVSLELVKRGYARFDKYSDLQSDADRKLFESAEESAKKDRLGIWSSGASAAGPEVSGIDAADRRTSEPAVQVPDPAKADVAVAPLGNANVEPQPAPPVVEKPAPPPQAEPVQAQALKSAPAVNTAASAAAKAATARCNDGSLSYRASRSGSCSGNGGVAEWLSGPGTPAASTSGDRKYVLGSRGGCYYIRPSGSKTYVDKKLCTQ
jgi:endonuclease YncB( thermonuclease family)